MPTPGDMTAKVALVTGAASGLGKATARLLAQQGAAVLVVDVDGDGLAATATEIEQSGARIIPLRADLGDPDQCVAAVNTALDNFGRLDALCNIAAVFMPGHTTDMSTADLQKTLAVNLAAPFILIRESLPHLIAADGAVVNVTSCAAFMGQAYMAAYSATKAGLTHLTKSLAMEYIHQPVRINAVAPGGMLTAMTDAMRRIPEPDVSLLQRLSPIRGVVEVEDVAAMVVYLASDAARGIHGACINFDNGITVG